MNRLLAYLLVLSLSINNLLADDVFNTDKYDRKFEKIKKINATAGDFDYEYIQLHKLLNEFRSETEYDDIDWQSLGPFQPASTDFPNPEVNGNGRVNDIEINPFDTNNIWVGSASGGVWQSFDKGENWELIESTDILSMGCADIEFSRINEGTIYLVTGDPHALKRYYSIGILKSTDNGENWDNIFPFETNDKIQFNDIELFENIDLMIAASNKGLFSSKISDIEWTVLHETESFVDIESVIKDKLYIYFSTYDYYFGDSKIYISSDSAKTIEIIRSYDEVENIELSVSDVSKNLYAMSSDIRFHKMLDLIYTKDNGASWITIADSSDHLELVRYQGFFNLVIENHPADSNVIYAGGVDLHRSTDHGNTWQKQLGMHVDHHELIFDQNNKPISGNDGGIYRYLDSNKWENLSHGLNITQIYGFEKHPLTNKYINIGTQDNGWQVFDNKEFYAKFAGDFINAVYHPNDPDLIFYTLPRGNVVYSSLAGNAELITPEYSEQRPWFTEVIYSNRLSGIITGGTNLFLNNSVNNGWKNIDTDWKKITDFNDTLKIHSIQEVGDSIYFSKGYKGYLLTENNIEVLFEMPHTINEIQYTENRNSILVCLESHVENQSIYEVVDDKIINISYNLPAIPVNTLEIYQGKILIGTNAGIFILDNDEWHYYGNNFPLAQVTDIKYDLENDVLSATTYGRGLWEVDNSNCNIVKPLISSDDKVYCKFEPITLKIENPLDSYTYKWWDGTEGLTKIMNNVFSKNYSLFAVAYDQKGCSAISNIINFQVDDTANIKLFLLGRNPVCQGDSTILYAQRDETNKGDFFWNTGETNDTIVIKESGEYFHYLQSQNNCFSFSDTVAINFVPKPSKPQISQEGIRLIANDGERYLWFRNSKRIENSNSKVIKIDSLGSYAVRVFNNYGCFMDSDPYLIDIIGAQTDFKYEISPNPVDEILKLELFLENEYDVSITIYDLTGKMIQSHHYTSLKNYKLFEYDVNNYADGVYFLEIKSDYVKKVLKFIKI